MGAGCCLAGVIDVHYDLVVSRAQVELSEIASDLESVEKLVHQWDGELVLGGVLIEGVVVDAETP